VDLNWRPCTQEDGPPAAALAGADVDEERVDLAWVPEPEEDEAGHVPDPATPADDEERIDLANPVPTTPDAGPALPPAEALSALPRLPQRPARTRGRRLVRPQPPSPPLTAPQRLLLLDTWQRSGLPARDFAPLVGVSRHTLYAWKKKFDQHGPAGLQESPRGRAPGSRLPDLTQRAILLLKQSHPDWGCQKISDVLWRGQGFAASPAAVARVLHAAGYELEETPTRPHDPPVRRFERARPNQLWQTDLFTFVLKRQNRRVYLVAFLDDHSRFLVGYGLHASASTALVLEVLRAALASYGRPEEVLTDNGSQYVTWRGTSAFTKELQKQGIKQIVAAPRRPQTLGKIERFWGTLWRECVEAAVFTDLGEARQRIGWFIDHYNFQRPHQGLDGLVPADRYFGAASAVRQTLAARVAANALELARRGVPAAPFYLTGQVDGRPFSLHAEGQRLVLQRGAGGPEAEPAAPAPAVPGPVCPHGLVAGGLGQEEPAPPGRSVVDELRPPQEGGQP
jgi:transposase InsO family protein